MIGQRLNRIMNQGLSLNSPNLVRFFNGSCRIFRNRQKTVLSIATSGTILPPGNFIFIQTLYCRIRIDISHREVDPWGFRGMYSPQMKIYSAPRSKRWQPPGTVLHVFFIVSNAQWEIMKKKVTHLLLKSLSVVTNSLKMSILSGFYCVNTTTTI